MTEIKTNIANARIHEIMKMTKMSDTVQLLQLQDK